MAIEMRYIAAFHLRETSKCELKMAFLICRIPAMSKICLVFVVVTYNVMFFTQFFSCLSNKYIGT